nr:RagB/SusD family nutrient uptake outer membrane protein [uncultured Chitinophaga sp.]
MKYSKLSILALTAVTTFSACNSKLDIVPGNALDDKDAVTEANVRILANGLYERAQELEYYGRDFNVVTDVTGNDMKITAANSNRFTLEFKYTFTPLSSAQSKTWLNAYRVANQASVIIDKLPETAATKPYKGEAYFMRALAHFDLARRFTRPYSQMQTKAGDANTGVPLAVKAVDNPATFKPSRATLKETYAAIISDLKAAKGMAPTAGSKTEAVFRASKEAASALLTRAYLYVGDTTKSADPNWQLVIDEATPLINAFPLWGDANYLANYTTNSATSEDIFSLRFLTPENRGADNFGNIYLPNDGTSTSGYGDVRLTESFMALLDAADYRTSMVKNFSGNNYMMKWVGNGLGLTGMSNVKILRISEVLLNRAEAYMRKGDLQMAVADLNNLRQHRGLAAITAADLGAVRAELIKQRRLELVGEGFAATDLFRLGGVRHVGDADALLQNDVLPTDPRVAFPISQIEIDANPNIVQNPGYNK